MSLSKAIVMYKFVVLLLLFPTILLGQSRDDKSKVLIVDGFSHHDWQQTNKVVKMILEKSNLFDVSVSTSPSEPEDKAWKSWNPKFKDYDVVLVNCNNIHNKEIKWPEKVESITLTIY